MARVRTGLLLSLSCSMLLIFPLACSDNDPLVRDDFNIEQGWSDVGFHTHWTLELELDWPYLYACAADEGLYRARVNVSDVSWKYIGLADTTISPTPFGHWMNRGVQDVAILDNGDILAGVVSYEPGVPGLFRSSDFGGSWEPSSPVSHDSTTHAMQVYKLEVCPCDPATVFACGDGSVYRSTDRGANWEHLWGGGGLGMNDIRIHPVDCSLGWGGGMSGFFGPLPVKTVDGGQTWEYVSLQNVLGTDNCIYRVGLNRENAREVYLCTTGMVIKTEDGGQDWSVLSFPVSGFGGVRALVIDDEDPAHLLIAAGTNMFESWDAGESMNVLDNPTKHTIEDMVYDSRRGTLYVGTRQGVFRYQMR